VTVAGVTGVVEDLSIRSIRLRAEDGSVQIIPFSAVTGVTNMTRDFSQAVIEAQVSYDEDYDKVAAALTEMAAEMRAEPLWQNDILGDIEVMGLVRMDTGTAVLKCRIRCGPFARWKVQREFYRRMKQGFAARGIEVPYTQPPAVRG
jgi:small-conductance mechanosensitive channel